MPLPDPDDQEPVRHELGPTVETLSRLARILERASAELSLSHYRVLAMVSSGDGRASRLAGRLALGKPAISAAVESLVSRGLLARTDLDPDRPRRGAGRPAASRHKSPSDSGRRQRRLACA